MNTPFPTTVADSTLAIATRGLSKHYGRRTALSDVALQVPAGSVYLLVGPNGAGKSTTIKILLNLLRADSGVASVLGLDSHSDAPRVRANIGYVPEQTEWGYGWMRVDRFLAHHKTYFPTWDDAYAKRLSDIFRLKLRSRLGSLSKGEARRVHLTTALAHRPPLLVLDEPTDGLDPVMRDETLAALVEHVSETQTTVFLSTHRIEEVDRLADHIGVLNEGVLRAQMSLGTLRENLNRYRAIIPDGWGGASALNGSVVRRVDTPREIEWTIWGEPSDVTGKLTHSNAQVHEVAPLSLIEATLCLLKPQG